MNIKIEKMREFGCDVDGAMRRMLGDEEFYIECLETIPNDKHFEMLENSLKSHNISAAFDDAHTLKGILANVGLTPMLNKTIEIVEQLRMDNDDNLLNKYYELDKMKKRLLEILEQ